MTSKTGVIKLNDNMQESLVIEKIGRLECLEMCRELLKRGIWDAEDLWKTGVRLLDDQISDRQINKMALKLFEKAAAQGHVAAMNDAGGVYFNGRGVRRDYKKAIVYFKKAAEKGFSRAQYNMGISSRKHFLE